MAVSTGFIPALSHIEMTGEGVSSLRKKFFKDGNVVVEQLNSRDEQARSMTWTTIYNTLGVANLWAAMNVESLGAGKVTGDLDDHCRAGQRR